MNSCYSDVHNNETPHQAWRAGFREGVKMALDQGVKPAREKFLNNHWKNMHRLYIWLMVGTDIKNGSWAIAGARQGLYYTMCTDWDYIQVRDFKSLNSLWKETYLEYGDELEDYSLELGRLIIKELDIPIAKQPLDAAQSKFFKEVYQNPSRSVSQQFIDKET